MCTGDDCQCRVGAVPGLLAAEAHLIPAWGMGERAAAARQGPRDREAASEGLRTSGEQRAS